MAAQVVSDGSLVVAGKEEGFNDTDNGFDALVAYKIDPSNRTVVWKWKVSWCSAPQAMEYFLGISFLLMTLTAICKMRKFHGIAHSLTKKSVGMMYT